MKYGVAIKLDVTKIDKEKLFQGKKGVYLDAVVFIDVDNKDQYDNNGMITQDAGKDANGQKIQGNILGNVQVFWSDSGAPQQQGYMEQQQQHAQKAPAPEPDMEFSDDIPF